MDLKWTRLAPDSVKINGVINMVAEDGSTIDTVADLQQQMNRLGRPTGADEGHPLVLVGSPLPPGTSIVAGLTLDFHAVSSSRTLVPLHFQVFVVAAVRG